MREPQKTLTCLSFIVKFWFEHGTPSSLRGRITRVTERGEDEQRSVKQPEEVAEYIKASLGDVGAFGGGWSRFGRWFRSGLRASLFRRR